MKKINGIGASKGIAIGTLLVLYLNNNSDIQKKSIMDVAFELTRLDAAKKEAIESLNKFI